MSYLFHNPYPLYISVKWQLVLIVLSSIILQM